MNTLQELFAKDGSWTQRAFARKNNGEVCVLDSEEAICWCLAGGIEKIYKYNDNNSIKKIRAIIADKLNIPKYSILDWNDMDERTIDDIRNLVKELNI